MIKFTVEGEPKAKQRPRFSSKTHTAFTPKQTIEYENWVKMCFKQQHPNHKMYEGPIIAHVVAYFKIPESVSKKKKEQMLNDTIKCMKKPDVDNIAKSVLDSLNNIAFKDDKQIVLLRVEKKYSDQPRVEVMLSELD